MGARCGSKSFGGQGGADRLVGPSGESTDQIVQGDGVYDSGQFLPADASAVGNGGVIGVVVSVKDAAYSADEDFDGFHGSWWVSESGCYS